jgi:glycosyltransferase involved in cell wall biosynthesis
MKARVSKLVKEGRIDAIFLEETNLLTNLPVKLSVPIIVDHHNVEHLLLERYVAYAGNWIRAVYAWLEARTVRRWERRASARANIVLVCSRHDRSAFLRLATGTPVVVAPNVIDGSAYTPIYEDDGRTVLYAGGMDWHPNRDAVEYFVISILPHIRLLVPRIKFVVAGRNVSPEFRERFASQPDVVFTGTVADIRTEIARAAVCVVPLRIGSGTRLKILEAAAMGKAIVSTSIGAEGLEFTDGEQIVLADDPLQFANAVAALLADVGRRRELGRGARARLEMQYTFPVLSGALVEAWGSLSHEKLAVARRRNGRNE